MAVAVFFIAQAAASPSSNKTTKTVDKSSTSTSTDSSSSSTSSNQGGGVEGTKTTTSAVQIPILVYHNISYYSGSDTVASKLHTSPTKFSEQMKYLSKNSYSVISLDAAYGILFEGKKSPSKPVVLTFDDGYADFYTNAFPILKSYRFTAATFIISQKPGTGGFLSWKQVEKIAGAGFEIGSKSVTNTDLTKVSANRASEEMSISRSDIAGETGLKINYFAYPYGAYNSALASLLSKSKYAGGLTMAGVNAKASQGDYAVARKIVDGRYSLSEFAALLK